MKWIFRLSLFQIAISFLMILLGGLVHNTGSSLACPDWPTCFGTFFPKMEGGVLVEHSHRLLGAFIGLSCIVQLVLGLKLRKKYKKVYLLNLAAMVLVVFQVVLGGITVLFRLPPQISTLHLATSQLFLLTLIAQAIAARWALNPFAAPKVPVPSLKLLLATLVLIYIQIVYGAAVRHFGYSAACGLGPDYSVLCMDAGSGQTVFWPAVGGSQFHMIHRILAALVAILVVASTIPFIIWAKRKNKSPVIRLVAASTHLIVAAQIGFGIWTVASHVDTLEVTLHLAGAVSLLATVFFLYLYLSVLGCGAKRSTA